MKSIIHCFAGAVLISTVLLSTAQVKAAGTEDRFFLMGSGVLHLENLRNDRKADVALLDASGEINESALTTVDHVFGFPTNEKEEHISPRMLFMLSYFSDLVAPGETIYIESAYRSPEYNEKIRKQGANAAKTSTHIDGMALDFYIESVDGKELWELVREKNCCGVGHYGGKSIHLDAGRPRFWEAATSGTKTTEPDYNRHIYLTTDFDRYAAGEQLRLSLSGVSIFDFGIRTTAQLYSDGESATPVATIPLITESTNECMKIDNRRDTRFLSASLPESLPAGRYSLQLEFCQKPVAKMPDTVVSSMIEVIR